MKQRILMTGPFLSMSGYGHQARFALSALRSCPDQFEIFIANTGWGATSWFVEDKKLKGYIDDKIIETIKYVQAGGSFDISLQISIPNEIKKQAPVNILYTAGIETTKVSPEWLNAVNEIDRVIVVSNHSKQVFCTTHYGVKNQTGQSMGTLSCEVPIDVVNYPVRKIRSAKSTLKLDYDFNFLTMAQWGPRKDLETVIHNFLDEFWDDEVGLVVKTFIGNNSLIDRDKTVERLETFTASFNEEKTTERKCKLYLVHGSMTEKEIHGLYKHEKIKAFVTATHGEGFGLSIFESAYLGLPVIAPGWSGHCDFLFKGNKQLFSNVKFTMATIAAEAVWDTILLADSMWAIVDPRDLRLKMRAIQANPSAAITKANALKKHLVATLTEKEQHQEFVDSVLAALPEAENVTDDEIDNWLGEMDINLVEAS